MLAKIAAKLLSQALKRDPGYLITWHANLSAMAQEAGAPHEAANKRAEAFLRRTFGADASYWRKGSLEGAVGEPDSEQPLDGLAKRTG